MKNGFDSYKGVWVGSGYTDQSIIKLNKIERKDREEIPNNLGYIVQKGRGKRIRLVDSFEEK